MRSPVKPTPPTANSSYEQSPAAPRHAQLRRIPVRLRDATPLVPGRDAYNPPPIDQLPARAARAQGRPAFGPGGRRDVGELLRIEDSDLAGLTFYVAEPEQTRITLDGRDAVGVKSTTPTIRGGGASHCRGLRWSSEPLSRAPRSLALPPVTRWLLQAWPIPICQPAPPEGVSILM
jgi:hypothetical protein